MDYLLFYDIGDTKKRYILSEYLKNKGFYRIQRSVFIGESTDKIINNIKKHIKNMQLDKKDKVHIVSICSKCYNKIKLFGSADLPEENSDFVI